MSKTNLNSLINLSTVGLALLTGATVALANDSDRNKSLAIELQELKTQKLTPIPTLPTPQKLNITVPELDRSKLQSMPLPNFDKSQLIGDWRSTEPFVAKYIGGSTRIEGITFSILPDSSLTKEWTSEGVFYESTTKDGLRRFPSSFNYKTLNNLLLLTVTFSANEIKNGIIIPFEILGVTQNDNKVRFLKVKNDGRIIDFKEEK